MTDKRIIYCDMDGVLCDFFSAVQQLTDQPVNSLSVSMMWSLTREQVNFWENLRWVSGGPQLWKVVDYYGAHILSALPYSDPSSDPGKREWLRNNIQLTDSSRIHLVTRRNAKQDYAMTNGVSNILIDDYKKNTDEWQAAGGIAILHTSAETSLQELHQFGYDVEQTSRNQW